MSLCDLCDINIFKEETTKILNPFREFWFIDNTFQNDFNGKFPFISGYLTLFTEW